MLVRVFTLNYTLYASLSQVFLSISSGLFSFPYLLYLCKYASAVGASCARDLASKG